MNTPYSQDNADFSSKAHLYARKILYPKMFGCNEDDLTFEDVTNGSSERDKILDGQMGVDQIVRVSLNGLTAPLCFTFQERFRKADYADFRDITITEWNHYSNLPSELYKINAGFFMYGYFDPIKNEFLEAVVFDTAGFLFQLTQDNIDWEVGKNPRSGQTFITVHFDTLSSQRLLVFHYRNGSN